VARGIETAATQLDRGAREEQLRSQVSSEVSRPARGDPLRLLHVVRGGRHDNQKTWKGLALEAIQPSLHPSSL